MQYTNGNRLQFNYKYSSEMQLGRLITLLLHLFAPDYHPQDPDKCRCCYVNNVKTQAGKIKMIK